jgi:hypothetical protein
MSLTTSRSDEIADLLRVDPLAEAERATGRSYKEDEATSELGFLLHLGHVERKKAALKAAGDSYFSMDLADTLGLYAGLGVLEVLVDEFEGAPWAIGEVGPPETYRILWHPDGLLATVESYETTGRNSTKVYYNLRVVDREGLWGRTSSGRLVGDVWAGDHDGREGIANNLAGLREVGDFLPVWAERPFLWLVNYSESKVGGYDYKAITAERISRLPAGVRDSIGIAR